MLTVNNQIGRFLTTGALATAAHIAVLIVAVELFNVSPLVGSSAGYLVGGIISYLLNYHWTFVSRTTHRIAVFKFVLMVLSGFLLNGVLLDLTLRTLKIHYFLCQIIASCAVVCWNFCISKFWTYR